MFHYRIKQYKQLYKKTILNLQYLVLSNHPGVITTWWFNKVVNFGDLLTPLLLRKYSMLPLYAEKNEADILFIGSILDTLTENYSGCIFGSGLIKNNTRRFRKAKIIAVRGELTRERISAPASTILGDPGLLAYKMIDQRSEKKYTLGLIPHFVDKDDPRIKTIIHRYKKDILFIDVQDSPKRVIKKIDQCKSILSSSLHGIVVADSLGIPNGWIQLSNEVLGNGFKFIDYGSAINRNLISLSICGQENLDDLLSMTQKIVPEVETVKNKLDNTLRSFLLDFKNNPNPFL